MVSLRDPARWPMSWWYAAAVVLAALIAAFLGAVYWAFHGEFWEPAGYGFAGALVVQVGGLWRQQRRRDHRA